MNKKNEATHGSQRPILVKIKNLIYPKVKHDIWWHRLITVIGWILSAALFWLFFIVIPLYFGVFQRMIYFVFYGNNKDKWLDKNNEEIEKKELKIFLTAEEIKKIDEEKYNKSFIAKIYAGRMGRLDYFLSFFLAFFLISITFLFIFLTPVMSEWVRNIYMTIVVSLIALFYLIFVIPFLFACHIRRLHDIELSGLWVMVAPVPIIGFLFFIFLLLKEGDKNGNEYGSINNSKSFFKRVLDLR